MFILRGDAMARERSDDKRQAILDAAMDLFVEHHFHGTAVPAIAERAGVADGTLYRYFEHNEALVNELYRQEEAELFSAIIRPYPPGATLRHKFLAIGERFSAFAEEHPKTICFLERNHHESYLTPESRMGELPLLQHINELLDEGKAQGII